MNPYVKIFIASGAAVYLSPMLVNRFVRPELTAGDATMNKFVDAGITGLITAGVFVLLTMASS